MKRKLIPFLVAGMLSATSCTELFEPSIDYGDQTYVNDYSALVSAVNDLNKALGERFDALNKLLEKEMAKISLSIDNNTGAINIMSSSVADSLSTINMTLFDGFKAIKTTLDANGDKIVSALDKNGNLLRLQIDSTGKLISTTLAGQIQDLIKNINDNNTALGNKIDALGNITQAGLADIKVSIDSQTNQLNAQLTGVNKELEKFNITIADLNTNMLNGFKALNTTVSENGTKTVEAINNQGVKIEAVINKNGELISTQIKNNGAEMIKAITSQTEELSKKYEALKTVIAAGFADVKATNTEIGNQLKLQVTKLNDINGTLGTIGTNVNSNTQAIVDMNKSLTDKLTVLNKTIADNGNTIVTAINEQKEAIVLEIDETGKLLSAKIEAQTEAIKKLMDAINSQTTKLEEKLEALNTLVKNGFANVQASLTGEGGIGSKLDLQATKLEGINASLGDVNTTLANINTALGKINNGLTVISSKLGPDGTTIVEAINAQGEKIAAKITANGEVISASIDTLAQDVADKNTQQLAKMAEIIGAIQTLQKNLGSLTDTEKAHNEAVMAELNKILAKDKIFKDPEDTQSLYMSQQKWNEVKDTETTAPAIYNSIQNSIETFKVKVTQKQIVNETAWNGTLENVNSNNSHDHATFTANTSQDKSVMVAGKTDKTFDGIQVVRVIKVPKSYHYSVKITYDGCSFKHIYKVKLVDALGIHYTDKDGNSCASDYTESSGSANTVGFELTVYHSSTGVIVDNVVAFAICCSHSN